MEIQWFHLTLIKALICLKKKGSARLALTYRDRCELVTVDGVKLSESHIQKVLSNSKNAACSFNQNTMDELARYVGYKDWNDFLRKNKIPPQIHLHTGKLYGKLRNEMEELVFKYCEENEKG
jgi:hypothetical protein